MTERQFVLADLTLAAQCWGQGEPVLALHGWMDNSGSFEALAQHWQHGELIALDLPGHGHSEHRQGPYYFVDYLLELYQVVEQLGCAVHLVGHSMGGMLCSAFAGLFPDKVKTLQLIDGLLPISNPPEHAAQTLRAAILSRLKHGRRPGRVYPSLREMAQVRSHNGDFSTQQAMPLVRRASILREDGYHWRTDPRLKTTSPLRLTPDQVQSLVAGIACPIAVYLGSEGLYTKDEARRQRELTLLGGIEPVWLEGGHHCHLQQPEALAMHLTKMLTLT
ncbi:alpha/beta fold hydrolase [Gallaecimonas pentaromativorans]|uniref:Pimeloyl-ACP methyl ester carboxylesterase n=1 Tax=Gallaecimonas pentaromativorans TaxID=584787 RepID=A0A3N1PSM0_9GAMM|nr:alpha/beta hydrolase [Gallaecimonas pentaromativorans]ROQ30111.1 pimeloyl-ACP methyl ester carboxylesterase [Gallaecimonas pentaromativorans]